MWQNFVCYCIFTHFFSSKWAIFLTFWKQILQMSWGVFKKMRILNLPHPPSLVLNGTQEALLGHAINVSVKMSLVVCEWPMKNWVNEWANFQNFSTIWAKISSDLRKYRNNLVILLKIWSQLVYKCISESLFLEKLVRVHCHIPSHVCQNQTWVPPWWSEHSWHLLLI